VGKTRSSGGIPVLQTNAKKTLIYWEFSRDNAEKKGRRKEERRETERIIRKGGNLPYTNDGKRHYIEGKKARVRGKRRRRCRFYKKSRPYGV